MDTYLSLTPYQFQRAYELFLDKTKKDRDQAESVAWQVARWQVWRMLCPPKEKRISVFDLIKLPGDELIEVMSKKKAEPAKDKKRFMALAEKWK